MRLKLNIRIGWDRVIMLWDTIGQDRTGKDRIRYDIDPPYYCLWVLAVIFAL